MIILDSNQLRAVGVHGNSKLTMLRAVARMTGHRLTIAEGALTELLDSFERDYAQRLKDFQGAEPGTSDFKSKRQRVLDEVPRQEGLHQWPVTGPEGYSVPTVNSARGMRERRVRRLCQVLDAPPGAAEEALRRESSRTPPARETSRSGRGGRDVAIWLTVLEAAKSYDGNVYFVSADTGFQGEDGRLHPTLVAEVHREKCFKLVYCQDVESLIDRLSCRVEPRGDLDRILVDHANNENRMFEDLVTDYRGWDAGRRTSHEIDDELVAQGVDPNRSLRAERDDAQYDHHDHVAVRRIGEETLTAARVVWRGSRHYASSDRHQRLEVSFSVRTSVLIREDSGGLRVECWYRWPASLDEPE